MNVKKLTVDFKSSIREAISIMDQGGIGVVFITETDKNVIGLITDGDFRRFVLKGINLNDNVSRIVNRKFVYIKEHESDKEIINSFLKNKIDRIPLLLNGKLKKVFLREDFQLEGKIVLPEKNLKMPVVIMAGGKGTRMAPFTNIFPKPLIPIGDRSMLEVIMDEYNKYGLNNFILSLNYKGNLIKAYFADLVHNYNIKYLNEDKYLGTAGAIKLIQVTDSTPIFVSNCDILIKDNYISILDFHKKGGFDLTLVAAMVHYKVPYGVCSIKNGGELDVLSEKPEYDFLVNTGMYILESSVLDLIPDDEFFHITHLMKKIQKNNGKVGIYPVSEKTWIDVGQWSEYNKTIKLMQD